MAIDWVSETVTERAGRVCRTAPLSVATAVVAAITGRAVWRTRLRDLNAVPSGFAARVDVQRPDRGRNVQRTGVLRARTRTRRKHENPHHRGRAAATPKT